MKPQVAWWRIDELLKTSDSDFVNDTWTSERHGLLWPIQNQLVPSKQNVRGFHRKATMMHLTSKCCLRLTIEIEEKDHFPTIYQYLTEGGTISEFHDVMCVFAIGGDAEEKCNGHSGNLFAIHQAFDSKTCSWDREKICSILQEKYTVLFKCQPCVCHEAVN